MTKLEDDRLQGEHITHSLLVGGRDTFMSGWGDAPHNSFAFWACRPADVNLVKRWVRSRGDIEVVRVKTGNKSLQPVKLGEGDHCHIYVVREGHPAQESLVQKERDRVRKEVSA